MKFSDRNLSKGPDCVAVSASSANALAFGAADC